MWLVIAIESSWQSGCANKSRIALSRLPHPFESIKSCLTAVQHSLPPIWVWCSRNSWSCKPGKVYMQLTTCMNANLYSTDANNNNNKNNNYGNENNCTCAESSRGCRQAFRYWSTCGCMPGKVGNFGSCHIKWTHTLPEQNTLQCTTHTHTLIYMVYIVMQWVGTPHA